MKKDNRAILIDSPEAATEVTVQAWRAPDGHVFLDEGTARYHGCTHVRCQECGAPVEKGWLLCRPCRKLHEIEEYEAMPRAAWDGETMLYSRLRDTYYHDLEIAERSLEEGQAIADLMLVICEPNYPSTLDSDFFIDDLPEDGELTEELEDVINTFNAAVGKCGPLSWSPGKFALLLPGTEGK